MNALLLSACLLPASDARTPYQVKLVVSVQKHPLLTTVFKQQTTRQLRDAAQAALGELGRVRVDGKNPLLRAIEEQGLDRAVGACRTRDGCLTHCVRLGYAGTRYEIQTRLHDGLTGLPGPVLHSGSTRDRAFVARLAALLIDRGMGLHGTILGEPDARRQVKVELRGGALGADLDRWIKQDEVFALVKVPEAGQGRQQSFTCLQAMGPPVRGVVTCRAWSHFTLSSVGPWTGAQAVLLPTKRGPLRLRLMQQSPAGLVPFEGTMGVRIRKHGFDGEAGGALKASLNGLRELDTSKRPDGEFDRLAFVTLREGATISDRFPVPILDDRIVTLPVTPGSTADKAARQAHAELMALMESAGAVQRVMFDDINELTKDPAKRAAAIARVRQTLRRGQRDRDRLAGMRAAAHELITKMDAKRKPSLASFDAKLKQLAQGEKELLETVTALEAIEKDVNDPRRKEWLIQVKQAEALERRGDAGEALRIYEAGPAKFQGEELKNHIKALKARWQAKSEAHRAARRFAYQEWAALPLAKLKEGVARADAALAEFRKAGDVYGPLKLRVGALKHADALLAAAKDLKPGVNAGDDEAAARMRELSAALQKLVKEAEEAIRGKE